jgi:hypothetical protein
MSVPLIHGRSNASDVYVQALASAYRSGLRLYDPDYALSREPDIYEKVRRDPIIAQAIEDRTPSIASKNWHCDARRPERDDDAKAAAIMEDLLRSIFRFSEGRHELALAVILARAYAFVETRREVRAFADGPALRWLVPTRLRGIDRRRVRIVPKRVRDEEGRVRLSTFLELYSPERMVWDAISRPELFVKHVYQDEEARLGHGRGLLEAIYFWWWSKGIALREGLQGLEKWAQGLTVVRVDGMRKTKSSNPNSTLAQAWLDAIEDSRARHAIVADKEDEIDVKFPGGQGNDLVIKIVEYLDDGITRLLSGSARPLGGGDAGSLDSGGQAKVEEDTSEGVVQYDRGLLDETISRDLVGLVWRLNRPNWVEMGLGEAECPIFSSEQQKREDPELGANVAATALGAGIPLVKEEVYRKIGYSVPKDGDEVIEPAAVGAGVGTPGLPDLDEFRIFRNAAGG